MESRRYPSGSIVTAKQRKALSMWRSLLEAHVEGQEKLHQRLSECETTSPSGTTSPSTK
jgi:hypothetical protein